MHAAGAGAARPRAQLRRAGGYSAGVLSREGCGDARIAPATTWIERSIRAVRAKHLPTGALTLLAFALAPSPAAGSGPLGARAASTRGPSVQSALAALERSGAVGQAAYQQDYSSFLAAEHSLGRLSGIRRRELAAVVANVQAIAAAGALTSSRLPALFL